MLAKALFGGFCCILFAQGIFAAELFKAYSARVIDYSPVKEATPVETMRRNVEYYIEEILKGTSLDILVFPEYGLTSTDVFNYNFTEILVTLPPESYEVLCRKEGIHDIVSRLSCAAREVNVYVVVNLLEKDVPTGDVYSTNIVFDKYGAMIAKYRKINLYTPEQKFLKAGTEKKTFTTTFGVTFGLITSQDILFKNPSGEIFGERNVTDVIFTTAWTSEVPFYTALGIQDGYAKKNGINLLAAGYSDPANSNGGSGFYYPGGQREVFIPKVPGVQTKTASHIEIITSRQPEKSCNPKISPRGIGQVPTIDAFKTKQMKNIQSYEYRKILSGDNGQFREEICKGSLCCNFKINFDPSLKEITQVYKAVVSDEACGLIACDDEENLQTCGSRDENLKNAIFNNITIQVKLENRDGQFMPVSSNLALEPFDYTYCDSPSSIVLSAVNQRGLVHFGFISGTNGASNVHNMGLLSLVGIMIVINNLFNR